MEFQIAEAIELIKTLAETENLTQSQALTAFVAEAGMGLEDASVLKAALFETYTLQEMASDSLTKALTNVFVAGESGAEDIQEVDTKETQEGTKYKVRVKDRASGSTYSRYATRAKIAELRANPNIASVELSDYGDAGEDKDGQRTAAAKSGKDYDGDGKKESSSKEHAGVVHNAIQRKMGGKPDGQDTRKEAFDPKGARRMDAAKGKKKETQDEINKRLMLGKYSPAVKYAKTRKEDVEYVDEVSKELATKAYAERKTNEFEADEKHTKSDKTRERIVKKHGEKAGEDADKAAEKKIYGEGIDFKGAKRIDDARAKKQAEKDKKSPSSKDYRLAMGKFRPGASNKERAEGGRDVMREKGTSPKKNGKKMFEQYLEARAALAEMRHRDAKTGEVTDKPEIGKTYYTDGPRQKSSVALRKEKEAAAKKKVAEGYKGKHGQSDSEYADSRSQGGKMVSGDSKMSGAEYTHGRRVKAANPGMQPDVGGKTKPKSQGKMDKGTRADLEYRKASLKKEEVSIEEAQDKAKKEPGNWNSAGVYVGPDRKSARLTSKKIRKEEFVAEADLVDSGRENQGQRDKKKLTGNGVDNSQSVKLMPVMDESVVTESGVTASERRLASSEANLEVRAQIKELWSSLVEKCCDKCGTPECTCESKKEEKPKKKMKIDEAGMPILEYSRNNATGPTKEMIDPPADANGEGGVMNPKGEPKRPHGGDRRPNRKKDKSLPNEDGTVPNGAGV